MKANELLFWLSARRQGSWQQFRAAVEELHAGDTERDAEGDGDFPLHQRLRLNLEGLGHVEFFASGCEGGWRVAPPTLATHSIPGGTRGVVCGARSPALYARLHRLRTDLGYETVDSDGAPTVVRIVAPDADAIARASSQAALHLQIDAPFALLSHLPTCGPPSPTQPATEFPRGNEWAISEFDAERLEWRRIENRNVQAVRFGLLRFLVHYQRPRYFLRWNGSTFEVPRAIGLYALLRRKRRMVLRYDAAACRLALPAVCRPPRLLERALMLCSGLPPVYELATVSLVYSDVPSDIADLAAKLLCQPFPNLGNS